MENTRLVSGVAGFKCEECNLVFKDNVKLIDHLRSREHCIKTGQDYTVKPATLADVKKRIEELARERGLISDQEQS